jgi:hypothetical protein
LFWQSDRGARRLTDIALSHLPLSNSAFSSLPEG